MLLFSNYHYAPMMSCINQEQKCGWPRMGDCYNHMSQHGRQNKKALLC